jgi:hypothetical protein
MTIVFKSVCFSADTNTFCSEYRVRGVNQAEAENYLQEELKSNYEAHAIPSFTMELATESEQEIFDPNKSNGCDDSSKSKINVRLMSYRPKQLEVE